MASTILTADSSVVVPALLLAHPEHRVSRAALIDVDAVPAHVVIEAFSVLTRLPSGLAASPATALRLIRSRFGDRPLSLSDADHIQFLDDLEASGIRGGQVYDALVAATARANGARVLTRDRRAAATYQAMHAEVSFVD